MEVVEHRAAAAEAHRLDHVPRGSTRETHVARRGHGVDAEQVHAAQDERHHRRVQLVAGRKSDAGDVAPEVHGARQPGEVLATEIVDRTSPLHGFQRLVAEVHVLPAKDLRGTDFTQVLVCVRLAAQRHHFIAAACQHVDGETADAAGCAVHEDRAVRRLLSVLFHAMHGQRGREEPAELEEHERGAVRREPEAAGLIPDAERGDAHLVGGAHVDAVHLPVGRDGVEVDDARQEDRREPARPHELERRAEPADPLRLPPVLGSDQDGEVEVLLGERGDRDQGFSRTARRSSSSGAPPSRSTRAAGARPASSAPSEASEEHLAVGEAADRSSACPDRHRARGHRDLDRGPTALTKLSWRATGRWAEVDDGIVPSKSCATQAVDLHLQAADAERAEHAAAVTSALVGRLDAADAERGPR